MSGALSRLRRKNNFNVYKEAKKLQSFDEYPLLRPEVDPQLHVSTNTVDQPFWLSTAKDCVLTQMSGGARIEFRDGPVRYFTIVPGEYAYVPAGAVHRVIVEKPGVQVRYKAREFGAEGVLWFCGKCDSELFRFDWAEGEMLPQAGYQAAVEQFNADEGKRTCKHCGEVHPAVDLTPFRWSAVADAIAREDDDDDDDDDDD